MRARACVRVSVCVCMSGGGAKGVIIYNAMSHCAISRRSRFIKIASCSMIIIIIMIIISAGRILDSERCLVLRAETEDSDKTVRMHRLI